MKFKLGKPTNDPYSGSSHEDPAKGHTSTTATSSEGHSKIFVQPPPTAPMMDQADRRRKARMERRASERTATIRGFLIAAALPLSALTVYLLLSGQSISLNPGRTDGLDPARGVRSQAGGGALDPSSADLPSALPNAIPTPIVRTAPTISASSVMLNSDRNLTANRSIAGQKTTSLVFDSNGRLISPYSIVFDSEGQVLSTRDKQEALAVLPSVNLGWVSSVKSLDQLKISNAPPKPPQQSALTMGSESLRQFHPYTIKLKGPNTYLEQLKIRVASRLNQAPTSVANLDSDRIADAVSDVKWAYDAAVYGQLSGDLSSHPSVIAILNEWSSHYAETQELAIQENFEKIILTYDLIQAIMKPEDREKMNTMLRQVAAEQFIRLRTQKLFDSETSRLIKTLFQISFVTADADLFAAAISSADAQSSRGLPDRSGELRRISTAGSAPSNQIIEEIESFANLMKIAVAMDQVRFLGPKHSFAINLNRYLSFLMTATRDPKFRQTYAAELASAFEGAIYFRPDLFPYYKASLAATHMARPNDDFGPYLTFNGLMQSLRRRPDSALSLPPAQSVGQATSTSPPQRNPSGSQKAPNLRPTNR